MIHDKAEHDLVIKALTSGLSNCVEWINPKAVNRVNTDPDMQGLTAEGVIQELLTFVRAGGQVDQVPETRPEYGHRRFYYKAVLPLPGFPLGLFVEFELDEDADPDVPSVFLLNAHPQKR